MKDKELRKMRQDPERKTVTQCMVETGETAVIFKKNQQTDRGELCLFGNKDTVCKLCNITHVLAQ